MPVLAASALRNVLQGEVYVADVGKALGTQQFVDGLRRNAGDRVPFQADRGNFRWRLGGERFSATTAA